MSLSCKKYGIDGSLATDSAEISGSWTLGGKDGSCGSSSEVSSSDWLTSEVPSGVRSRTTAVDSSGLSSGERERFSSSLEVCIARSQ